MVGLPPTDIPPTLAIKFASAGFAACCADIVTFPLDTSKVRLQIQGEGISASGVRYRGMFGTLSTIIRHEGVRGLYNGLNAGLQRQMCFASVRIGLYDSVKAYYVKKLGAKQGSSGDVFLRILAGCTTGAMAVSFAQPTDVVKVRFQAQLPHMPKRYTGTFNAYVTIFKKEGIRGLWKGTLPNITRNAIVNATELVCYDIIKEKIINYQLMSDNLPCHLTSAFAAGFITTCVASPVDVVKTRFMNSPPGQYTGAANCAIEMFKDGGLKAFYKGFMPSYMRLGSWNILMFVLFEQYKRAFTVAQYGQAAYAQGR